MNSRIEFNRNKITSAFDREHRLDEYIRLLLDENSRLNLVSRETNLESAHQMALESLLPLEILSSAPIGSYLDIGSGGGLPAIPIILSGAISGSAILMERTGKKASAVQRIVASLNLSAKVIPENFPSGLVKPGFDLITLKWVKLESGLLSKIARFLSPQGRFVHYSSESVSSEIMSSHTYSFEAPQAGVIKGFTLYQKKQEIQETA